MGGADEIERVPVKEVTPENRTEFISDTFEIDGYTRFTFPGRNGQYSQFVWDFQCFSGVDYNAGTQENAIYSIQNGYGEDDGNADFPVNGRSVSVWAVQQ